MSGIYIPGMAMPKRDATFLVHVNGVVIDLTPPRKYCEDYHREKMFYKLIYVPDHGRLIDGDELVSDFQRALDKEGEDWLLSPIKIAQRAMRCADLEKIKNAPTVIPAERSVMMEFE